MTRRAMAFPFSDILGDVGSVDSLVTIANLGGLEFPNLAVTGRLPSKRVSNFMKQDLMHQVKISMSHQVL